MIEAAGFTTLFLEAFPVQRLVIAGHRGFCGGVNMAL